LLLLAACSGGEGEGNGSAASANEAAAAGEDLLPTPEEAEHLADEAAADEAADMNLYGGNAAAGETGNAAAGASGNAF
jgi:hypothetical protein